MAKHNLKPRIGLIVSTLMQDEFNDFTSTRPAALASLQHLKKVLGQKGDVTSLGLLETEEDAYQTRREFLAQEVDIIIYAALSYNKGSVVSRVLLGNDIPLVIWNTQECAALSGELTFDQVWTNSGLAGIPELCNTLIRAGRTFEFVTGQMDDKSAHEAIGSYIQTASLKKYLSNCRIAMLGQVYPGMTDFMIDNFSLSRVVGPGVFPVEPYRVVDELEKVQAGQISALIDDMHTRYTVQIKNPAILEHSAKLALAMEKVICEDYQADAVAILDQVWLREPRVGIPPIFPMIYLNSKGIPCSNEVDVASAAAQLILRFLAGKSAIQEFFDMNFQENTIVLVHDSNGNPAMAKHAGEVVLKEAPMYSGAWGNGVACEFVYPEGELTLLSVAPVPSGWRLIFTEGEAVESKGRVMGAPFLNFKSADGDLAQFCEKWCKAGATHHMGFAYGKWAKQLELLAKFLKLEAVRV